MPHLPRHPRHPRHPRLRPAPLDRPRRGRWWRGLSALALLGTALALASPGPARAQADANADAVNHDLADADASRSGIDPEARRIAVIEQVQPTVVSIFGRYRATGGGSGVVIHPDGLVLTNFHVVRAAGRKGWAGLPDGRLYRWTLVAVDPGGDLALIELGRPREMHALPADPADPSAVPALDPTGDASPAPASATPSFPFARFGSTRSLHPGDPTLALGNPFNLNEDFRPTVTQGIVSALHRYQPGQNQSNLLVYGDCIQIDTSINPGNSGGPLFDLSGRLLGINGRVSFEERVRVNVGVGYAITIEQCLNFLPDLLSARVAEHATLDATFAQRDGRVLCDKLDTEGVAARAGLRLGDRLLRFDGLDISHVNQLTNRITTLPAGWPVTLVVERSSPDGTVTQVPIRLRLAAIDYQPRPTRDQPADRPAQTPGENPVIRPASDDPVPMAQGKVTDAGINARQARRLWNMWRSARTAATTDPPSSIDARVSELAGAIRLAADDAPQSLRSLDAHRLARLLLDPSTDDQTRFALLGSDRVDDEPVARLSVRPTDGPAFVVGLALLDPTNAWAVRPLTLASPDDPDQVLRLGSWNLDAPQPAPPSVTAFHMLAPPADDDSRPGRPLDDRSPPTADPDRLTAAIAYAQQRTVKLFGAGIAREHGYAAGVIVSPHGDILTATGVYLASPRLSVVLPDGRSHPARVHARSDDLQTAWLKIDAPTPAYFDLSHASDPAVLPRPGDPVAAISNPYRLASPGDPAELLSAQAGVVSLRAQLDTKRRMRDIDYHGEVLLIDAVTSNPGSPGGSVVDAHGRLVGMIGKTIESATTNTRLNYAVPADLLAAFVAGRGDQTANPANPASGDPAPASAQQPIDLGVRLFVLSGKRAPAFVDSVIPGSPAQRAGLRKDDLIMGLNSVPIRSIRDWEESVADLRSAKASLLVKRGQEVLSIQLTPSPPDREPRP